MITKLLGCPETTSYKSTLIRCAGVGTDNHALISAHNVPTTGRNPSELRTDVTTAEWACWRPRRLIFQVFIGLGVPKPLALSREITPQGALGFERRWALFGLFRSLISRRQGLDQPRSREFPSGTLQNCWMIPKDLVSCAPGLSNLSPLGYHLVYMNWSLKRF